MQDKKIIATKKRLKRLLALKTRIEDILAYEAKKAQKERKLAQKRQKILQELYLYKKLNELIGSASGDKFRKIAQRYTFDNLVHLANIHLLKLQERYILQRGEGFELFVRDNFQAGVKRGVATLSGGESFLVSLAFALALSDLVSDKIDIKTLFLDEGFGTLDEETLESVLSALNTLQHQGKVIGIISHVNALKERIPRHIELKKVARGKSTLTIH